MPRAMTVSEDQLIPSGGTPSLQQLVSYMPSHTFAQSLPLRVSVQPSMYTAVSDPRNNVNSEDVTLILQLQLKNQRGDRFCSESLSQETSQPNPDLCARRLADSALFSAAS